MTSPTPTTPSISKVDTSKVDTSKVDTSKVDTPKVDTSTPPAVTTPTLRPYQQQVLDLLLASQQSGIVVAPTGSGKSLIIDALVRHYARPIVVVNELTVKGQLGDRLPDHIPIISPLSFDPAVPYDLIVIDEVHHYRRDRAWGRVLSHPSARVIGFTATPVWDPSLSLPLLVRIPYAVLREQGFLAAPLTGVLSRSDEETDAALSTSLCRRTVFYVSQKEQWNGAHMGRLITADTPADQRHFMPEDIRPDGSARICNIATLTTGWDDPDIDSIVLCRRIGADNPQTYLQIIGRLRRGGVVVDRADNILRFGLDEDALSAILGQRGVSTPSLAPALKRCMGCQRLLHPRQTVCPYCGFACPPPHRSGKLWEPLPVNAWLRLLSPDRLAPLRWKLCPYTPRGLWPIKLPGANITVWVGRGDGVEKWSFVWRILKEGSEKGASFWVVPGSSWIMTPSPEGDVVYARDLTRGEEGTWVCIGRRPRSAGSEQEEASGSEREEASGEE